MARDAPRRDDFAHVGPRGGMARFGTQRPGLLDAVVRHRDFGVVAAEPFARIAREAANRSHRHLAESPSAAGNR